MSDHQPPRVVCCVSYDGARYWSQTLCGRDILAGKQDRAEAFGWSIDWAFVTCPDCLRIRKSKETIDGHHTA